MTFVYVCVSDIGYFFCDKNTSPKQLKKGNIGLISVFRYYPWLQEKLDSQNKSQCHHSQEL